MKNLNKKQKIILTLLGIGIIALVALGATYAYFLAVVEPGEKAPVDIITDTTDNLLFDVKDNINLAINKYNFGVGGDNLTSHAKATATLRANSTDNTATYNYYLYFNIESNEFVYTTEDHKPEIILTITDPSGNPVTTVTGLTYVTAGDVSGFDITTASGLFTIASNYEITSNSSAEDTLQEWNFTAIFINLDSDQNDNTGKSMKGSIVIQRVSAAATLADICKNGDNLSNCIKQYADGDFVGKSNIIHHNGTIISTIENNTLGLNIGDVLDANDGSYRYNGADTKKIADAHKDEYSSILKTSSTTEKPLIGFMCGTTETYIGETCTEETKYYYLMYDETKTQYEHYNLALEQAIKDGYVERNYVDNFVCFGSNEEVCPYDNLYRIIGVFDSEIVGADGTLTGEKEKRLKLIKYDAANENLLGSNGEMVSATISTLSSAYKSNYKGIVPLLNKYTWNKTNYNQAYTETKNRNVWSYSELNKTNLNTNYLNNIGEEWSNKIATSNWIVGGNVNSYLNRTAPTIFQYEIKNPVTTVPSTYKAKVGLMYISDYAYANSMLNWDKNLGVTSRTGNWMYMGIMEWTITRTSNAQYVFGIIPTSGMSFQAVNVDNTAKTVRPVFYLNTDVSYASGDGSIENPIRIGV